jgi:acyl-coenzyme A thioesterase PaaI-like protein
MDRDLDLIFFTCRHVHGGAIATILDSVMGNCTGYASFTVNLNVQYKR